MEVYAQFAEFQGVGEFVFYSFVRDRVAAVVRLLRNCALRPLIVVASNYCFAWTWIRYV